MMIKRLYALRVVEPHLVGTKSMVAYLFTKAIVEPAVFLQFREYLLNLPNGPGTQVLRPEAYPVAHVVGAPACLAMGAIE